MDILGKRLRELRIAEGLNQIDVAEALNISQSTYSAYERGTNPGLEIVVLLAKYFNTSLDYLLGNTPPAITQAKRGDQVMQRLARVSYQEGVKNPVTPEVVTEFIDALIAYIAANTPSGTAPIDTAGRTLRALSALLESAAGDNFAELLDAANAVAVAGLSASDATKEYIERRKGDGA